MIPLLPGHYYHIYNRGNNGGNIFFEEKNYRYFLKLYARYIQPVAETFAYCLLRNHFHILVRVRTDDERQAGEVTQSVLKPPHRYLNNLFIAYTKSLNKAYNRTGSLMEKPFKRKLVDSDRYFMQLITYIHQNPQKHGFVDDFRVWPWM